MAFQPASPYTLGALINDLGAHEHAGRFAMFTSDPDYSARDTFLASLPLDRLKTFCRARGNPFNADSLETLCAQAAERDGKTLSDFLQVDVAAGVELLAGTTGNTAGLIEQLLVGPDDAELTPRELAFLEAHLANHPCIIDAAEWSGGETTKPEEDYRKLATIRDFNQKRQAALTPPAPDQMNGNAGSDAPAAKTEQSEGTGGKKRRGAPPKKTTKQRAEYAKPLVNDGLTWPEIYDRYAKTAKGKADKGANADAMRLAFGREYPAK